MSEAVGLIAGNGKLPHLIASGIRAAGGSVVTIAHRGTTRKDLASRSAVLHWINIGELGKMIELLVREGVKKAIFAGAIPKTHFFSNARPDARGIQFLLRLKDRKDDSLLRAVADEVEGEGVAVISPIPYLEGSVAPAGCWTARKATEREEKDIDFGWAAATAFGLLDVGQCIVVKDQMVLAVEAIEGTDATIRRGGRLGRGDVMAIKICKPKQDQRLDLPVIGPRTITTLKQAGASCLVVEAGKTVVVDREEVVRRADANRICLIGK
ncbi:MAG TPA: UDP-2,3-diacylglucosamine diphosphatase LpxI [Thermodesulfobacteriota bacterium]|nr:UDP-2,3-diacylglucosamine diphosphatase LpxI [Thermodesulfobacteriota bacterium]